MSSAEIPRNMTSSPDMAAPLPSPAEPKRRHVRKDTLATSLIFLLGLSATQPLVSFARGILFCRTLSPAELGAWDMVLSFIMLAGTVVVIGIPGSFGRYVEHYAQRGQLSMFMRRTTVLCAALTVLAMVVMYLAAPTFSNMIFGRPDRIQWVYYVAAGLGSLIAWGFVVELLTAMRLFRVVSGMQLFKAIAFVLLTMGMLFLWEGGPASVILGHAIASMMAVGIALYWLIPAWHSSPEQVSEAYAGDEAELQFPTAWGFWAKLMPFAAWVWIANFCTHLFEMIDRYMLVHFSGMPSEEALTQVGHYHSSRIVPIFLVSFASMLASMLLPHFTKDWERNRRDAVSEGLNLAIKLLGLALCAGAAVVMLIAPYIFEYAFAGRYDGGLAVLPWTLAYCVWFSMFFLGDIYLSCAERVRLLSVALFIGLCVNVVMNLMLLPTYGLFGAVWATAFSKFVVLIATFMFAQRLGLKLHRGAWLITLLPLSICLGTTAAWSIVLVALVATLSTDSILSAGEKRRLLDLANPYVQRFFPRLGGWLMPANRDVTAE